MNLALSNNHSLVGQSLLVKLADDLLGIGGTEPQAAHLHLGRDKLKDLSRGYLIALELNPRQRLLRYRAPQRQQLGRPHNDPVVGALSAYANGYGSELLVHAEPILMIPAAEVAPIVVRALVYALDGQRALLHRACVLPQSFAGRRLEDAYAVSEGWPVDAVALGATCQADLALALAARLVAKERT